MGMWISTLVNPYDQRVLFRDWGFARVLGPPQGSLAHEETDLAA
jgi:hypothetical protein